MGCLSGIEQLPPTPHFFVVKRERRSKLRRMDRSVLIPLRATRVRALVCASALTAGFSLLSACSKATQTDATPSIVPTAAAGQKAEPAVEQGIGAVLAAYESLRKALAGDDLAAAQAAAKQVAEASTAATKTAAPTQTAGLEALRSRSNGRVPAPDLGRNRGPQAIRRGEQTPHHAVNQ